MKTVTTLNVKQSQPRQWERHLKMLVTSSFVHFTIIPSGLAWKMFTNYPGIKLVSAICRLEEINWKVVCWNVFTPSSTKLKNRPFDTVDRTNTPVKRTNMKNSCAKYKKQFATFLVPVVVVIVVQVIAQHWLTKRTIQMARSPMICTQTALNSYLSNEIRGCRHTLKKPFNTTSLMESYCLNDPLFLILCFEHMQHSVPTLWWQNIWLDSLVDGSQGTELQ